MRHLVRAAIPSVLLLLFGALPNPPGVSAETRIRAPGGPDGTVVHAGTDPAPGFGLEVSPAAPQQAAPRALYEPGISPDGSEIAFVSGGDIWTVPAGGGDARLLVAHGANESRPLYAPDGSRLAFVSDREGSDDIWILTLGTGDLTRLTWDTGAEALEGWSSDSAWIYFSSTAEDVSGSSDVFRVRTSGGTPMAVAADRYESEFFASPSPDGSRVALATRGRMARSQWWRNGSSHIDEAEIWVVTVASPPVFERFAEGGRNVWPMWTSDGARIVWVSDRTGAENLWTAEVGASPPAMGLPPSASGLPPGPSEIDRTPAAAGEPTALTTFTDGRVLWPSLAADAPVVAFERDFGIWTLDLTTNEASRVSIRLVGAADSRPPDVENLTSGFDDLSVSPDGEKLAFIAASDVYVASAEDGGDAFRVTRTAADESGVIWAEDSETLVYLSWRTGIPKLWQYSFETEEETQLTTGDVRDHSPAFSPDGTRLAYLRGTDDVRVRDWETGAERTIARAAVGRGPFLGRGDLVWSPDGRWLAFSGRTEETDFPQVQIVPADGSAPPRPVSFVANANVGSIAWSPDGRMILFRTSQRTEESTLVRVDLVPETPLFAEDDFWALFRDSEAPPDVRGPPTDDPATEAAADSAARQGEGDADVPPEIAQPVFEDIRLRNSIVPIGVSAGNVIISPDAKTALVSGNDGTGTRLYAWSLDPKDPGNRREVLSGGTQDLQFAGDNSREVWYIRGGQIRAANVQSGNERTISVRVEAVSRFEELGEEVFRQAWTEMRDGFYDEDLHGVDWERVREEMGPYAAAARTPSELSRVISLMLGELDGSHLGVSGGPGGGVQGDTPSPGALGVRFDREEYEEQGRFRVTELVQLGPAEVSGEIEVGDYLLSINGEALGAETNLHRVLAGTSGDKVTVEVADDATGAGRRTVELKPISGGAERQLHYRGWVESRRAYVDSVSGGRLGYVHIASMSEGALNQLILDLDEENHRKEGVIVDVRNNNGGFVNVYAIDILARRNYFQMRSRGQPPMPSRLQLGQRAILAPTALVTNQHTLSDGEDFAQGFRTLELGPIIGEPTAGWIIYTSSVGIAGGYSIRMPYIEIRDPEGQVMERAPRPVDVEVERPAGEWYSGRDIQLEAAVRALLARLIA